MLVLLTATMLVSACGSDGDHTAHGSGDDAPVSQDAHGSPEGHDMAAASGDGLSDVRDGYRLEAVSLSVPQGVAATLAFRIVGPDGRVQRKFADEQTRFLHAYVVRGDLTGYQHLHPTMATDGTWSAPLTIASAGPYRLYADFSAIDDAGASHPEVLSRPFSVEGTYEPVVLPDPSASLSVDGYDLEVSGQFMAGMSHDLTVRVSRGGAPVRDLEPYLGTHAHLTAFKSGSGAFAHLHPQDQSAGPELRFMASFPEAGRYRLFLQFQQAGTLRTAAFTVQVNE